MSDDADYALEQRDRLQARVDEFSAGQEAVEDLLVDSIERWMKVPNDGMSYAHGNAQGVARALAAMRGTTFSDEWSAGLDRYQNRVVQGKDRL